MTATPNQALQRTGSPVTAPAADRRHLSARRQVPRPLRLSLSLRSFYQEIQEIVKTHPLTALSEDVWKEIDFIFWRNEVSCLPKGSTGDGFLAANIETTKRGVEIEGKMTFLGGSRGYFEHPMLLCLSRPRFSSIESVVPDKIRAAEISEAKVEGKMLYVTVQ